MSIADDIVSVETPAAAEEGQAEQGAEQTVTEENKEANTEGNQQDESQFSARFAALSRKEKAIVDQQAQMKADSEKFDKVSSLESKIKENPLAVLEHYGITLDQLVSHTLGDEAPAPTAEAQIESLRAEIEGFKQAKIDEVQKAKDDSAEQTKTAQEEAVVAHQQQIGTLLSDSKEKYELIHLQGAQELVWEVTETHFAKHSEVLTPEQAADKVEEYLDKQVRSAMDLKRFKPEDKKTTSPFMVEQVKPTVKQSQTLTSEHVQQAKPSETKTLNTEDSKQQAANLLKWN